MAKKRLSKKSAIVKPNPAKSGFNKELGKFEEILAMMARHQLTTFEWETASEKIVLKTGASHAASEVMMPYSAPQSVDLFQSKNASTSKVDSQPTPALSTNHKKVLSPFVGTFYRAASPSAEVYVKEGQTVKRGQSLCIIEAMKLMNEIESEYAGKIIKIYAENGQPVEFGEPLFLIET